MVHTYGTTSSSSTAGQAKTALNRLLRVAEEEGIDIRQFCQDQDIDSTILFAKGSYVNRHDYYNATKNVINSLGIPDISFRVGRNFSFNNLGILGHAILSSADLTEAVYTYLNHREAFGSVFNVSGIKNEKGLFITAEASPMDEIIHRHLIENWLLTWSHLPDLIDSSDTIFKGIHVPFKEPQYSELYYKAFNCPLYFNSTRAQIHISLEAAGYPLKYANSGAYKLCESECAFAKKMLSQSKNLEHLIKAKLYTSYEKFPSTRDIAHELNLSPRTLRRRMSELGTSYNKMLYEVRMDRASHYHKENRLSIKEIAFILGYKDVPSYHRAFKNHFSITPQNYINKPFK
ncbi:MAG: hypothetical protein COA93_04800 [Alphaproteobacteria bacterium]|nr:MAG: hypothetical protein COA93_04800 [Alphaproteobacteria bacterium]